MDSIIAIAGLALGIACAVALWRVLSRRSLPAPPPAIDKPDKPARAVDTERAPTEVDAAETELVTGTSAADTAPAIAPPTQDAAVKPTSLPPPTPRPGTAKVRIEPVSAQPAPAYVALRDDADARRTAYRSTLSSTRQGLASKIRALFQSKPTPGNTALFEGLEDALIATDVGAALAAELVDAVKQRLVAEGHGAQVDEERLWRLLHDEAIARLASAERPLRSNGTPMTILVVGVNGTGKTTTTGKLASRLASDGRRVMLAAADTFRAAAVPQLEVWGRRVGCEVVKGKEGTDPASVAFEAVKAAQTQGAHALLIDTAGRLHTKAPLMDELGKVHRSTTKALGRNPDETLLVLDATTGQNGLTQARTFLDALPLTGIVVTKLDGTARGGIALAIAKECDLPILFVGTGERVDDLRAFSAADFVQSCFSPSE